MTTLVLTIGLIALMFLLFVGLSTFSNSTRAYAVISFVPVVLGLTLFALRSLSGPGDSGYWWGDLCDKVVWATTIQTGLGVVLIARATYQHRPLLLLTFATFLTGSMFWLRIFRWI